MIKKNSCEYSIDKNHVCLSVTSVSQSGVCDNCLFDVSFFISIDIRGTCPEETKGRTVRAGIFLWADLRFLEGVIEISIRNVNGICLFSRN